MLRLIVFYQRWISPLLPPRCRFYPTCSEYAAGAIESHGKWRGSLLAFRRICKCHPFHPGGYDPVPNDRESGCKTASSHDRDQTTPNRHNTLNQ